MAITGPFSRHAAEVKRIWPGEFRVFLGAVVRPIDNDPSKGWSQHAYGNAGDYSGSSVRMAALAAWAVRTAGSWQVATVIWNRRIWSSKTREWRAYGGKSPHTDHVHIDYLPQWTGTPPGHPVGSSGVISRDYPLPPTLAIPYGPSWLRVVATAMYGSGVTSTTPDRASEASAQNAVREYNRRVGLPVSAAVISRTWDALDNTTTSRGRAGRTVSELQWYLYFYGFLGRSDIDGVFGPRTEQAVVRFEAQAQLRVDGLVGSNEWRALWFGPTGWSGDSPPNVQAGVWVRPPDAQPTGEIDHSWATTLEGLHPQARDANIDASWGARTMRSLRT